MQVQPSASRAPLTRLPIEPSAADAFLRRCHDANPQPGASVPPSAATLAANWRQLGLQAGDLVMLQLPNSSSLLLHAFGVILAQGVPVLGFMNIPPERLLRQIEALRVAAVVARRPPNIAGYKHRERIGDMSVVMTDSDKPSLTNPGEFVVLTSGTSGHQTACVLGFREMQLNAARHASAITMTASDRILVNLPLQFSYALVAQALAALATGAEVIITEPPFSASRYVKAIADWDVSSSSLTPTLVRSLIRHAPGLPDSLRLLTIGGDQIDVLTLQEAMKLKGGTLKVFVTYGLTEAGPRVSTLAAHEEPERRLSSVGRPLPGTTVTLHTQGRRDGSGELLVQSDTLMKRRLGARLDGGNDWERPGVLATGDVFKLDCDHYLYFQGRLRDFVVVKGDKVSLGSVRLLLQSIPGVISVQTVPLAGEGFDATIVVERSDAEMSDLLERGIRRLLRAHERPSRLSLVARSDTWSQNK